MPGRLVGKWSFMWSAPANSKRVENTIAVRFWPTRSRYTFARFTSAREIAEFGPVAPAPVVSIRSSGRRGPVPPGRA